MEIRKMALALPLAFGIACSSTQDTRTAEAPPPAGTGATTEGSPGAAGSDAEGGRVATSPTTPGSTGTYGTEGSATMGGASDLKEHASDQVLMGRVSSVSGSSLSIESQMGESQTLTVVPQTVITVDGREGRISDIQEGQPIRASFNEQEGKQVAVKIEAGRMMGGHMGDMGEMGGHHGDMGTTGTGTGADTAAEGETSGTAPADTGTTTDTETDSGMRR